MHDRIAGVSTLDVIAPAPVILTLNLRSTTSGNAALAATPALEDHPPEALSSQFAQFEPRVLCMPNTASNSVHHGVVLGIFIMVVGGLADRIVGQILAARHAMNGRVRARDSLAANSQGGA